MNEEPPIRLDGATKRYRRQLAVDQLNLTVPNGAVFGLLGENGAGKTTTIQMILGLIAADGGTVRTLGLDPGLEGVEVRRRVGYVPEQPVLYDWMTVAEIGWFAAGFQGGCPGGPSGYQDRYRALVSGYELPLDRKVRHLSKGMRAEVSLSLALASEPALLVLDEPTSGLDLLVRRAFLESMVDLAGAGRTVLLSSHQIAEVERVASHVALMHRGKLLLAEPLDELRARTFVLTLTFLDLQCPPGLPPGLAVEVVDAENSARRGRWLVHAADRSACEAVRNLTGVGDLVIETPGLEEIYMAIMRARRVSDG